MTKKDREIIYNKFNGKCAYCGCDLLDDWEVDHVTSKASFAYKTFFNSSTPIDEISRELKKVNDIDNLFPAIKIINHYKRACDLESFRTYMMTFHKRISKLPKNPTVHKSIKKKRIHDAYC